MHGAGNDYIYVNTLRYPIQDPETVAIAWSKPHTGIGSDGLVLIGSSDVADFSMRIFNADGSEARMCGNASRCIGKYLYEYGLTKKTTVTLETLSGIKTLYLHPDKEGTVNAVTVEMGEPTDIHPVDLGNSYDFAHGIAVNMGNPHLVIFTDDVESIDLSAVGPGLEHHPLFPDRVNVEFAQINPDGTIRMRVWERGYWSLCYSSCSGFQPTSRPRVRHSYGWRHITYRMARTRQPGLHDRSGRHCFRRREETLKSDLNQFIPIWH